MSYGVIMFRIRDPNWNPLQKLASSDTASLFIPMDQVEFCLIQRKDSLGFVELVRGKYKMQDFEYIRDQIHGMTQQERTMLLTNTFDQLWQHVWGPENKQ